MDKDGQKIYLPSETSRETKSCSEFERSPRKVPIHARSRQRRPSGFHHQLGPTQSEEQNSAQKCSNTFSGCHGICIDHWVGQGAVLAASSHRKDSRRSIVPILSVGTSKEALLISADMKPTTDLRLRPQTRCYDDPFEPHVSETCTASKEKHYTCRCLYHVVL